MLTSNQIDNTLINLNDNICKREYVLFSDEIELKTGFARGSIMSNVIHNLKKIKAKQPDIKVAIKNTTEDLDFYAYILRKIPDIYFVLDKEYASQYSKKSILEWELFEREHNKI